MWERNHPPGNRITEEGGKACWLEPGALWLSGLQTGAGICAMSLLVLGIYTTAAGVPGSQADRMSRINQLL